MKMSTKMLVEAGLMIALAQILSYVKVYELVYGGSITLGSMIPILVFAIRWGTKPGILVGTIYGVLQFLLGPKYSFHPLSIFLDYLLAFGLLGLAGLFRKNIISITASIAIAMFGRFLSHFVSGVIIWKSTIEGMNYYLSSIVYNGSYMLPEFIISLILISVIYNSFKKIFEQKT